MNSIEELMSAMSALINSAEGRSLTNDEVAEYEGYEQSLTAARRDGEVRARQQAYESPVPLQGAVTATDRPSNPLAFSRSALDSVHAAVRTRTAGRFDADQIQNAALTTTTYGQPTTWQSGLLTGPRLLHQVAGVPTADIDAILAEFPKLVLPAAVAGVGEGVSLPEFAASTGGSATLSRFGRFTDFSAESRVGTDVGAVLGAHQIGIARDLNKVLIDAAELDAGTAAAFSADVPAAIRKAVAQVLDQTSEEDPARLVILVHPDNAALLQDVAPVGGNSIAERFQRFSGCRVFPSAAVDSGFITVANLAAGARYFEANRLTVASDSDVKTGVATIASSLIGGYATSLVTDYSEKVDVVTP